MFSLPLVPRASSTLSGGRTFCDRHDAEELEVQAGDRCLSDILAQPLHRGQSEGNLIPVQDLQEANLQQEGWRKEAPSLTTPPGPTQITPPMILRGLDPTTTPGDLTPQLGRTLLGICLMGPTAPQWPIL